MASLFFSYSHKDIDSARKLTKAFEGQDLDFWIDWEGIPPTVDWWNEIEKAIEEADIFLFLLSPDSAKSKVCKQEIEHAAKNGKRLIPVVVRDVNAEETPSEIQPLNWIFLRENDNFSDAFGKLMTAIKTDYEWVQTHRQLQVKALEWERSSKENSFLLRGKELQDAEFQLAANSSKEPIPTNLQREYVFSSKQAIIRQRRVVASISTAVVIIIAWLTYTPLKSWLSIPEMPDWEALSTFKGQAPRHVTMDLRNPDEVYLSDQTPGLLYTSADGGNHWNDLVIDEMNNEIVGLSALESNLYALTSKAIWHSLDEGKTWVTLKNLPCDDNAELLSISVNPKNGNEIYVGANNGMVCHTLDNGKTWETFQQGYDGKSINSITTNGSTIALATEEGLWVKSVKNNNWARLSLTDCSDRSGEVRALAFTRPYEETPPDGAFGFFSAIAGAGVCDSDTLNLHGSTQVSLPDDSYVNISSIVIADIPGWGYEGYMTADGKVLRKRIWYAYDCEWWKIKFQSLLTKGD
jgi:hypothetical protein